MGGDGSEVDTGLTITTPASHALSAIHHRMPAIIKPADFEMWLDCERVEAPSAAQLLVPAEDDYFIAEAIASASPGTSEEDQPKLL